MSGTCRSAVFPSSALRSAAVNRRLFYCIEFGVKMQMWRLFRTRPNQSIMCIPFQVNRFQKIISFIFQSKYSESCSEDFFLKNPTKI